MSSRRLITASERSKLEPFVVATGDASPRDQRDLMERPFFSLAKARRTTPILYEAGDVRVEVYAAGLELANGFGELTDAVEQRRRFEADMEKKQRLYGMRYPIDEAFLAALAHMPEAVGMALGFDRLVMLATGAAHIEDVLWAPVA